MTDKQVNIHYIGSVQGVGFRYNARSIAQHLGVVGWVKNLPDGGVELVAEGEEEKLKELKENIRQEMGNYISDEQASWEAATGVFRDFSIRF